MPKTIAEFISAHKTPRPGFMGSKYRKPYITSASRLTVGGIVTLSGKANGTVKLEVSTKHQAYTVYLQGYTKAEAESKFHELCDIARHSPQEGI